MDSILDQGADTQGEDTDSHGREVTTLDFSIAFPDLPRSEREFGIHCGPQDGGCFWEFMVAEVQGSAGLIGIQVRIFDDAWAAYAEIPDFFAALADMGKNSTLDDVKNLCRILGYRDRTDEYVVKHEHSFRCACGARRGGGA